MRRRNPKAKWALPDVVDPVGRRCVRVYVPDNDAHIAAFRGALLALQSAYNWADDDAHTARDVALVWRDIIRDMGTDWGCGIDTIEFRQPTNCALEVRIDGGLWTPIFHSYNCALEAIADSIADGTIAAPSQQPAGGTLPPSECHTYNITLNANNRWQSPVPVSAGYTVTVTNARGAWSGDNAILSIWACVDGTQFSIGACGSALPGIPGDPIPALSHMRLIGYCNTIYMDMYNTTYTVPAGTPDSSFFLQCNDSDIANNQGSVTLTVTICNYSQWCYSFDFTTGQHGFVPYEDTYEGQPRIWGTYETGVGWHQGNTNTNAIYVIKAGVTGVITQAIYEYNITNPCQNPGAYAIKNATIVATDTTAQQTYTLPITDSVWNNQEFRSWAGNRVGAQAFTWTLKSVTLSGTGPNPFGSSNC